MGGNWTGCSALKVSAGTYRAIHSVGSSHIEQCVVWDVQRYFYHGFTIRITSRRAQVGSTGVGIEIKVRIECILSCIDFVPRLGTICVSKSRTTKRAIS